MCGGKRCKTLDWKSMGLGENTIVLDKEKDKDEDSVENMFAKINTMLSAMTIGTVAMTTIVPTLFVFLLYRIIRR